MTDIKREIERMHHYCEKAKAELELCERLYNWLLEQAAKEDSGADSKGVPD